MQPLFITFEGVEGSGKTTQIAAAVDHLRRRGREVVATREPGGTQVADRIRAILLDRDTAGLDPVAELLLLLAARAQHVAEAVRPALAAGKVVVCDRFADATVAYQGYGRGLDLARIAEINAWATGGLVPDLTVLLDLPVEEGLARARRRVGEAGGAEGRFEDEAIAFHRRVREGYLALASAQPARIERVDASGTPDEVAARVRAVLQERAR
jgi:dTMP kinase